MIPPSLSVENQDAGVNSPPAITAVRTDEQALAEADALNPAIFQRGEGALNITLLDTDQTDTLFVRVFVDYSVDDPTAPRASCTATPVMAAKRSVTCDALALCRREDVTSGRTLNMNVMVFDRQPLEAGEPAYQAMPEGGLSASKFFFAKCEERSMSR